MYYYVFIYTQWHTAALRRSNVIARTGTNFSDKFIGGAATIHNTRPLMVRARPAAHHDDRRAVRVGRSCG